MVLVLVTLTLTAFTMRQVRFYSFSETTPVGTDLLGIDLVAQGLARDAVTADPDKSKNPGRYYDQAAAFLAVHDRLPAGALQVNAAYGTMELTRGGVCMRIVADRTGGTGLLVPCVDPAADADLPEVGILRPTPSSVAAGTLHLVASAADNSAVVRVSFHLSGLATPVPATRVDFGSSWAADLDTTSVPDGLRYLTVVAEDGAGNVFESAAQPLHVANEVPAVTLTSPVPGQLQAGMLGVAVTASGGSGSVSSVTYFLDGVEAAKSVTSPFGVSLDTRPMTEGAHVLTAKVTSSLDRTAESAPVTFHVDNSRPLLSLTSPVSGAQVKGPISWSATSSDNVAVGRVELLVGADPSAPGPVGQVSSVSPYSGSWDLAGFNDGFVHFSARSTDTAGNVRVTAPVPGVIDRTAPVVSWNAPSLDEALRGTVTLDVSASDLQSVVTAFEVTTSDGVTKALTGSGPTGGSRYTAPWDTALAPDGPATLRFTATDPAGWTTSVTRSVLVDNTVPTASWVSPADTSWVRSVAELKVEASDTGSGIDTVSFTAGAVALGAGTDAGGTFTRSWDTTVHGDGESVVVAATARDRAGNAVSGSRTFRVDNLDPTGAVDPIPSTISGQFTVTGTVADAHSGVQGVTAGFGGVPQWNLPVTAGAYSGSVETRNVVDGSRTFTIVHRDVAGNKQSFTGSTSINNSSPAAFTLDAPTTATVGTPFAVSASTGANATTTGTRVVFYTAADPESARTQFGEDTSAPYDASFTPSSAGTIWVVAMLTEADGTPVATVAKSVTVS